MNEDLNKELCQLLGICWHEIKFDPTGSNEFPYCQHCGRQDIPWHWEYPNGKCLRIASINPDFTSEVGRVQLLKLIKKHKHFHRLIAKINCLSLDEDGDFIDNCIPVDLMTDDTGKLAIAARDFLKGQ
jgi:hypothetical protein